MLHAREAAVFYNCTTVVHSVNAFSAIVLNYLKGLLYLQFGLDYLLESGVISWFG